MKIKPIKFIEKKWLAIILIASLIEPVHYFLLINYPLPGKTFMAYDADEATVAGVMRSVELDFDNPWSKGEKVFFNGALGSPYPYLMLGYIRMLFGIDALLMNIIAKFLLFFVFLLVLFKAMEALMPRRHELAFIFFLLPLGLMPIGYMLGYVTGVERLMEGFSFEFSILNNISRVYYFVPLITSLLSLLFFSKGKKTHTTIFLGLTFFFYPFFGFAFAGLMFLYSVSGKHGKIQDKFKQSVNELWKIYAVAAIFLAPWIYARFVHPEYFTLYSQNSLWWRAHLVGILGSYFILLGIIFFANMQQAKKNWKFLLIAGVLAITIMIFELKALGVSPFTSLMLPNAILDISELLFIALFAVGWLVLESGLDRRHKFIILAVLALFPLSILNPKYVFWMQYRMGYLLHIPLAMLAALYFDPFVAKMKSFGVRKTIVVAVIGIFALASFLAYNYRYQMADRWIGQVYLDKSDKDAMLFLNTQQKGVVLASDETNYFLPPWSGQYVLYHPAESQYLGGGPDRQKKKADVAAFYEGGMDEDEFRDMLLRYGIDYVFYGSKEQQLGGVDLESVDFVEKIYDSETAVYKVRL
ncbi:MAG: hypothetical protein J4469_03180 [Candidatus Aenigmarchaeota archaeon]|nr:hypothetical protein [Candidatus Aenigmarchaeota archaeon]